MVGGRFPGPCSPAAAAVPASVLCPSAARLPTPLLTSDPPADCVVVRLPKQLPGSCKRWVRPPLVQVEDNMAAVKVIPKLTPEVLARIEGIVRTHE